MGISSLFQNLSHGEFYTVGTRKLVRISTNQERVINRFAARSFTPNLFGGIQGWLETVNDALALTGWRLVWVEQRLRVREKGRREYMHSSRTFSPHPQTGRLVPHRHAHQLLLRAERLPLP